MKFINLKKNIKNNLVWGIIMCNCAILISYLMSDWAKEIALGILTISSVVVVMYSLILNIIKNKGKKTKVFTRILLTVVSVIMFSCISIYTLAPSQLFQPYFDKDAYAKVKKYKQVEEVKIQSGSQELGGLFLQNTSTPKAPLVIYFGGNGETSARRMVNILEKKNLQGMFSGYNVAIIDYPGYGKSKGNPSEDSLKDMGIATFDALSKREDVDPENIIIMGYSIGTGVANYVASEREANGLLLLAPYADGYDLYNSFADIFYGPMKLLVKFPMESVEFAEDISEKPLLLASRSDEMIGYESSVRLSKAYKSDVIFETIEGVKHNDFWGSKEVQQYIKEYLKGEPIKCGVE